MGALVAVAVVGAGVCGAFGELRPPHFVTSSQRVAVVVAAAGGACWSASSTSLSLKAGEVLLCSLPWLVRCRCARGA